jgi:hypothetical protein
LGSYEYRDAGQGGLDVPSEGGFKDHGEYEVVKGFEAQKLGHTITAIFDPSADTETGFLSCFAEPQEAAEFLTFKRRR